MIQKIFMMYKLYDPLHKLRTEYILVRSSCTFIIFTVTRRVPFSGKYIINVSIVHNVYIILRASASLHNFYCKQLFFPRAFFHSFSVALFYM